MLTALHRFAERRRIRRAARGQWIELRPGGRWTTRTVGATTDSVAPSQRRINKTRESAERQAKRDRIKAQVASGELVIRRATAAERRQWQREREQRSR